MQGIKYIFAAFLAISATQCQASEFPISADKVELRVFVENGAAIAKNMFTAVNSGLDQSKPYMDKILNELEPSARTLIRKIIDEVRALIKEEDNRVAYLFNTLSKALDNLKPIKTCSDKVSAPAKKLALTTERDITNIVQGVQTKYKKEIENIKVGADKTIQKARKYLYSDIDSAVKCLTPGKKDANDCINKVVEKVLQDVSEIVSEVLILIQTADDTLSPILPEVIEKLLPLLEKTLKDGKYLLKTLTDCVATLK